MAEQKSIIPFGEEVSKLLERMNGISHGARELFLWELVRIAMAGLYQLSRMGLYDYNVIDDSRGLFIDIIPDKNNHTLTIVDNGIGMTEDYLTQVFTSPKIAPDIYKDIIDKLKKKEVNVDEFYVRNWDVSLGFFAAYMVAYKVCITTKHRVGDGQCTLIFSPSDSMDISVESCTSYSPRGTKVTLHLNKEHYEYLEGERLKELIDKYTFDLCPYPISIRLNNFNIIQRLADVEEKREDMEAMRKKFEHLRKLFQEVLGSLVKEVTVCDRIYDFPSYLSLDGKRLEINPRNPLMEKLRKDAENTKDDDLEYEEEVVGMIRLQYQCCKACIYLHHLRKREEGDV